MRTTTAPDFVTLRMLLRLLLLLAVCLMVVCGQNVQFDDETAGENIDTVATKGIQLKNFIRDRFMARLDAVSDILEWVQQSLDDSLSIDQMPNLTAIMEEKLYNVSDRLQVAENLLNSLNLTEKDKGQPTYYDGSSGEVNVQSAYSSTDNQFTAPRDGLYMIVVKSDYGSYGVDISVMRNEDETITSLSVPMYYYYKTMMALELTWLDKWDNITVSGDTPDYFAVTLLRAQHLMPSST